MIYEGKLTVYSLQNTAEKGRMPKEGLVKVCEEYYGERTIGVTRQYAALGADRRIDMLVRIWRNEAVTPGMYVIPDDGQQYRIDFIQKTTDEDGLKVSDLTLVRLEENYDVTATVPETVCPIPGS